MCIADIDVDNYDIVGEQSGRRDGMGRGFPSEFEQMVLLAILRLKREAYALAIVGELDREAGRSVSQGALYKTLERMEAKGYLAWSTEASTPDRGGHPRRLFTVTPAGVEVLRTSMEALLRLWRGLGPILDRRSA